MDCNKLECRSFRQSNGKSLGNQWKLSVQGAYKHISFYFQVLFETFFLKVFLE